MTESTFEEYYPYFGVGHKSHLSATVENKKGNLILSGSYDNSIKLWSVVHKREIRSFRGHSKFISSLCFFNNSDFFVSGSNDNSVRVWDMLSGKQVKLICEHPDEILDIKITGNDNIIVTLSRAKVTVFLVDGWECIFEFDSHDDSYSSIAISPDNKKLLTSSFMGVVRLWDLYTGDFIEEYLGFSHFNSAYFNSNGTLILVLNSRGSIEHYGVGVKIYDILTNTIVSQLAFSDYNSFKSTIVSFGFDFIQKSVGINDMCEISTKKLWQHSWGFNTLLTYSPDFLATDLEKKAYTLFNLLSSRHSEIQVGYDNFIKIIAISYDGKHGIVMDSTPDLGDSSVYVLLGIIDTGDEESVRFFSLEHSEYSLACISFDSNYVLTSNDRTLYLWDFQSQGLLLELDTHSYRISAIAFSKGNDFFVSASEVGNICLWDFKTGRLIKLLEGICFSVNSIAVSPGGALIAATYNNGSIVLWDKESGKLQEISSGFDKANRISFSADNENLLISSTFASSELANSITIINIKARKVIAVIPIFINPNDYLIYDWDGFFDGKKETIEKMVSFTSGLDVQLPYAKENYPVFNYYYSPERFEFVRELFSSV